MASSFARREFITLLGSGLSWPLAAHAQQEDRTRALQTRILRLQAEAAASTIGQFIREIESQISWTLLLPWSADAMNLRTEQRRSNAVQLLRQVPAIAEFAQLDPSGKLQLRLSRSRYAMPTVDPKCFREEPLRTRGEVGGPGIDVAMQDDLIKVVTPLDQGPAARAGLLANDIITKLDDEQVQGLTFNQALEKMRGPVNTKIKLTILRKGQDKPVEITITREPIRLPLSVSRDTSVDADVSKCPDAAAADMSKEPKFSVAMAKKVYYGPVYLGRQGEPYMTLSLTGVRPNVGVSVAEVNLKLIQDVVRATKVGDRGVAYVVDAEGRVIAHPDNGLVQRDFSNLAHLRAARAGGPAPFTGGVDVGRDINGNEILATYAPVARPNLGWLVFVELPIEEANAPAR